MKPKAIYKGFSSHDCESWYECPVCNKLFGDWVIFIQSENENGTNDYCPYCGSELEIGM